MSDTSTRELERKAASGDPDAVEALHRQNERVYGVKTILDYARIKVGDWAYLEGPNYHEIGRLVEVGLDEIGRGVAVLEHCKRKKNETTGNGPEILFVSAGGVQAIPTTEISLAQRAADRYGKAWTPWA